MHSSARLATSTTVAQRACRWECPGCLPLLLQFLFSPLYLVLKGKGINVTAKQHLFRISKLTCRFRSRLEQCVQDLYSGNTTIFCQPGFPLHRSDPLFIYNIAVPMLKQLCSMAHQSENLGPIPINCVVQVLNECLAALSGFMRTKTNASLPFAKF